MSAASPARKYVSVRITETRRGTFSPVSRMSEFSPFASYQANDVMKRVGSEKTEVVSFKDRADALRDAAVKPHTNWSSRQAAIVDLHALSCRLARLQPGPGYSDKAVRAFAGKLRRVAFLLPENCGDCLELLDDMLAAYIEGALEAINGTAPEEVTDEDADGHKVALLATSQLAGATDARATFTASFSSVKEAA